MTTELSVTDTIVRTGVDVPVSPARAFAVFTEGLDTWWNRGHHLLDDDLAEVGIESFVGGAVWERSTAGDTCVWGRVLRWEPDTAFAFSWLIGPTWTVPSADAPGSRVTVTFTPTATGTRVELVHDLLDRHGDGWEGLAGSVAAPRGWPAHLASFAHRAG